MLLHPVVGGLFAGAAGGAASVATAAAINKVTGGGKERAPAAVRAAAPAADAAPEGACKCAPMEPDSLYYHRGSVIQTSLEEGEFEVLEKGLGAAGSKACPQKLVPQQTYRLKGLRFTVSAAPDEETGLYAVEVRRTAPKAMALEE